MNKKGFTLIELLVVIAIIGLLSTMAVVSLNSARVKARDARRLADVKQLSTAIELAAANSSSSSYLTILDDCNTVSAKTTTCGTITNLNFANVVDPSAGAAGAACTGASVAACAYAVSSVPTSSSYDICFYLETGAGSLSAAGAYHVEEGGSMASGCPAV